MATTGNLGNVLKPPAPPPYNYRDPRYAEWLAGQNNQDLTNGGQDTSLVTTPPLNTATGGQSQDPRANPPPGAGPGHWLGNQWILDEINYPPTGTVGSGHYENGVWISDPPPETSAPSAPPTTPAPVTAPDEGGGGGGGSSAPAPSAPPATTVSDTYRDIISQMLNTSAPSYTSPSYAQPTRTPTTLNLPPKSQYDELVNAQIRKMLSGPTAEEAGQAAANSIPVSAYRNSILRDLGVAQAGAAEQSGLTGTQGSGGFAGQTEARRQAAGESTAQFTGEYVDKAMADRRAELQQALQMAQQQGNFEDAQALSAELARLNLEEERYKSDLSLYSTNVNADLQREQNANQRYATEVQKLLGMSDTELRRYLGELQNATNRYGIDVGAGTAADRLGLDWRKQLTDEQNAEIDRILNGPKGK